MYRISLGPGAAGLYDVTVLADELYSRLVYGKLHLPIYVRSRGWRPYGYPIGSQQDGISQRLPARCGYRFPATSPTALRAPAYGQHVLLSWLRDDHAWLAGRPRPSRR